MSEPVDYVVQETRCLEFGYEIDRGLGAGGRAPEPGDISICMRCRSINIFADDGGLRLPTGKEMHDIAGDPDLLRHMEALRRAKESYERTHPGRKWMEGDDD
jgi:hypothetical protein